VHTARDGEATAPGEQAMLIWGSRSKNVELGVVATQPCGTCEKERPFKLVLDYRYGHLWYLFRLVLEKNYAIVCEVCRRGWRVDAAKAEAGLGRNPIPFATRWSWAALVGLVALCLAGGAVANRSQRGAADRYLQAPAINDRYLMDVAKLTHSTDGEAKFGVMRLKAVTDGMAEFQLSKNVHKYQSDARVDLSGKATADEYYLDRTMTMPIAKLGELRADGTLIDIERR
jgi:hypothetical protein